LGRDLFKEMVCFSHTAKGVVSALVLLMVSDLEAGKMKKASAEDSFVFLYSLVSLTASGGRSAHCGSREF